MASTSRKVRKNVRISQEALTRAQRLLGASTETEAIEQALDFVAFRHEVIEGVRRLAGTRSLRRLPAK